MQEVWTGCYTGSRLYTVVLQKSAYPHFLLSLLYGVNVNVGYFELSLEASSLVWGSKVNTLHSFATTLHLHANLLLQIYISYRLLTLLTLCFLLKFSFMVSMVTYGLWNSLKTLSGPQCFVFPNYTYQWTTAYSVSSSSDEMFAAMLIVGVLCLDGGNCEVNMHGFNVQEVHFAMPLPAAG